MTMTRSRMMSCKVSVVLSSAMYIRSYIREPLWVVSSYYILVDLRLPFVMHRD
jgi:hypothetical protein